MDRATFDGLVLEHLTAAQRFAIRLTGDASAAEDLVQDTLLRAHRGWQTFRCQSKFQTWLFQIVVNCFRDRLSRDAVRAGKQIDAAALDEAAEFRDGSVPDPAGQASARELGELVAAEVSNLPERQREVLVLVAYEELSTSEVAAMLGITEQSVRTNLHLARERLRHRLAKHLDVEKSKGRRT